MSVAPEEETAKHCFNEALKLIEAGDWSEATESLKRALAYSPRRKSVRLNLATALIHLERTTEAEKILQDSLKLFPGDIHFAYPLARLLLETRPEESIRLAQTIASTESLEPEDLIAVALLFTDLGHGTEALHAFQKAERSVQLPIVALTGKARALAQLFKYEEALELIKQALTIRPDSEDTLLERAQILQASGDAESALAQYDSLLANNPKLAEALINRGNLLNNLGFFSQAVDDLEKALSCTADIEPIALFNLSKAYNGLKENDKAIRVLEKLVSVCPTYPAAKGILLHQKMLCCDWSGYDRLVEEIQADVSLGHPAAEPFGVQAWSDSESFIQSAVTLYTQHYYPRIKRDCEQKIARSNKIRIGYVCGEYREHATMILMEGVFKSHNKEKFELHGFSTTEPSPIDYSERIISYFDSFHFIHQLSDAGACKRIQQLGIDILINLNGYYGAYRMGLFRLRPAPIQINYLGFPGTLGANYMDYIIADEIVIPKTSMRFYAEKVIYLPRCYQPNNQMRPAVDCSYSKETLGFNRSQFVYGSFNNNYKLTPQHFALWLDILQKTPNSVLLLLLDNDHGKQNIINTTNSAGIDSSRIKFLKRCSMPEHLARHQAIDLFLDTAPYTGHTTLSDAIWMGIPTVSLVSDTFPGRVSKSLLSAIGMNDLIVETSEEYLTIATRAAQEPEFLAGLRARLARGVKESALYDSASYTSELEVVLQRISNSI